MTTWSTVYSFKTRGYTDEIEYLKYPKNKWRNIEPLSSDDNLHVSPLEYFLLPGGSGVFLQNKSTRRGNSMIGQLKERHF